MFKNISLLVFCLSFCIHSYAQEVLNSSTYDSIIKLRKLGGDESKTLEDRFKYAKRAVAGQCAHAQERP